MKNDSNSTGKKAYTTPKLVIISQQTQEIVLANCKTALGGNSATNNSTCKANKTIGGCTAVPCNVVGAS